MDRNTTYPTAIFAAFMTLVFIGIWCWNCTNPFFWDHVLVSKAASEMYRKGFAAFPLPDNLDLLPPTFSAYIAIVWKLLGRTLWVSHLAVLPFVIGIIWQFFRLCQKCIPKGMVPYALMICAVEPTLLAQISMISPELPILFFFLLSLNLILANKRLGLAFALVALSLIYLRGTMLVACLWVFEAGMSWNKKSVRNLLTNTRAYIPALLLTFTFYVWHYQAKGYWVVNPESGWAESQQWEGLTGILKNLVVIVWRWMDFGRFILFAFLVGLLSYVRQKEQRKLIWMTFSVPILLSLMFLPFSNPIAHRYYLPFYVLLVILVANQFQHIRYSLARGLSAGLILFLLASGHFWIYPEGIAQGWDASLAHKPYFNLKDEMVRFIQEEALDPTKIATAFPNRSTSDAMNLDGSQLQFADFEQGKYPYLFYSNVYNDFSDEFLADLKSWKIVHQLEAGGVRVILYQDPYFGLE